MRLNTLLIKANESIFAICLAAIMPIKPLVLLVGVCISLDTLFALLLRRIIHVNVFFLCWYVLFLLHTNVSPIFLFLS